MATCFNPFRLRRSKSKPLELPPSSSSSRTQWNSSDMVTIDKKRFDSLESWSMILESDNVESWEVSKVNWEEWTADLSQLFIGNKFAYGAHSRIYRGIYKQRAVAVKMVRIPTHKEETRAKLEQQFKSEVRLLSRLYHLSIVQVADFGTSCLETQCREAKGNMGTYRWMPPEIIKEKPYTRKVDVYSFRIVLWEFTTALLPFQGITPVQAAFVVAEKNERPPLPASCQPALAHLIKRCWAANPSKRPNFTDIVSALKKYDECVKEGLPLTLHSGLVSRNAIFELLKGCVSMSSSITVHV
ncbi:Serine/threonine-protein kinase ht1 [Datura stramonium]|uniref:Serine/threonine-protein kinase ht1 n=1 Tax=Datura stramonium TaxID=4076 RepID=A0ABS8S3T5_DATST|nr:Serine/threonine-protein kinase ht1 [Datura stramonium]